MPTSRDSKSAFLLDPIVVWLEQHRGQWFTPHELWEMIQRDHPDLAERVVDHVRGYVNPTRTNEAWFVTNAMWQVGQMAGFTESNTKEHPEMAAPGRWLIVRADP